MQMANSRQHHCSFAHTCGGIQRIQKGGSQDACLEISWYAAHSEIVYCTCAQLSNGFLATFPETGVPWWEAGSTMILRCPVTLMLSVPSESPQVPSQKAPVSHIAGSCFTSIAWGWQGKRFFLAALPPAAAVWIAWVYHPSLFQKPSCRRVSGDRTRKEKSNPVWHYAVLQCLPQNELATALGLASWLPSFEIPSYFGYWRAALRRESHAVWTGWRACQGCQGRFVTAMASLPTTPKRAR